MEENHANGSMGSESNSSGDEGQLIIRSQASSVDGDVLVQGSSKPKSNFSSEDSNHSGDEETSLVRSKKRVQLLFDSDGEPATEAKKVSSGVEGKKISSGNESKSQSECDSDTDIRKHKTVLHRSRLRKMSTSGDESDSDAKNNASGNEEDQLSRIKDKRNKLRQKFKNLHNKKIKKIIAVTEHDQVNENVEDTESQSNNYEDSSIENIKQIIKSSLYDPDTSDEESSVPNKKTAIQNKGRKSTRPTSPKPLRMSAKQAMENMQKIKSESNRMLREKEVSLPYHRPKALSLKDIMSRRRAAVSADGKALPIKMNDEQLKQYAQILEERQKEVIELCKSDTEEEDDDVEKTENNTDDLLDIASQNDTLYNDLTNVESQPNSSTDLVQVTSDNNILPDNGANDQEISTHYDINDNEKNISNNDTNVNKEYIDTDTDVIIDLNVKEVKSKTNDLESIPIDTNLVEPISKGHESNALEENNSMEVDLVYNDSVEETSTVWTEKNCEMTHKIEVTKNRTNTVSDVDSQVIPLRYDTEKSDSNTERANDVENSEDVEEPIAGPSKKTVDVEMSIEKNQSNNDFSDDDMNMEDIDALIENAEIALSQKNTGNIYSPMLIKEPLPLTGKPKLTGAPGMVIDLDGTDPLVPKKLSGVELLKERFVYFAKLKTPEESEREREKRIKPGMQHMKLKLELEEQIAEQRSLEWAKRLEEEKQHQNELKALRGEGSDDGEDIDEIEAKLNEKEDVIEKESSSEGEEEEELEQEIVDKPRKRNPMVDDEAEESDCESEDGKHDIKRNEIDGDKENNTDDDADIADDEDDESEESSEDSDESEDDQQNKPKKGRILKAFEDSDDEDTPKIVNGKENENDDIKTTIESNKDKGSVFDNSQVSKNTQDDELHLAQKSVSEDLFTSQESSIVNSGKINLVSNITDNNITENSYEDKQLGTQTFSILESTKQNTDLDFPMPNTLFVPRDTQSYEDSSLDAVVGMCSGSFSQTQNLVPPSQTAEVPVSQVIGDDVLALCTGQFYDNQFVSQEDSEDKRMSQDNMQDENKIAKNLNSDVYTEDNDSKQTQSDLMDTIKIQNSKEHFQTHTSRPDIDDDSTEKKNTSEDPNLKSILDELNDPEFDSPKPNKYFVSSDSQNKENKQSIANAQFKKKFIIDSDEDDKEDQDLKKKKKFKKKKMQQRALQISDDEDDAEEEVVENESELEEDKDQIVEYDSEENEVIVQPQHPKKNRKLGEFFEQEAELTSEDEWIGSGDEDEAGLDRMEREEGDDDTFNQNKLQRELGQIHMRDVLDQDKREVRLIQELLFEDADLGGGSRQRKFRWKNSDGDEETGTINDEFADTQEEEFESEEQWRKQRHERETFLKSLKNQEDPEESLNVSVNRTSIIKANLSKNTSNIFVEINSSIEEIETSVPEKKMATAKDIPSPKKPFTIFQQNYHGSLLTRGRGALARLAALATPLTNDDDSPKVGSLKPTSKRNFVFASIDAPTPADEPHKVTKRKAEGNVGTPRLVKKLRTEDKQKYSKSSLLDHMKI